VRYCSGFKPLAATWAVVVFKLSLLNQNCLIQTLEPGRFPPARALINKVAECSDRTIVLSKWLVALLSSVTRENASGH